MNLVYLFYFILKSDYSYINKETKKVKNKSVFLVLLNMIFSTLKYGSSFEDYFIYEFYNKSKVDKESVVTTGYARRFFKQMNNTKYLEPFRDKGLFEKKFKSFIKRDTIIINNATELDFIQWVANKSEVIVKPIDGVQGKGIYKAKVDTSQKVKKLFSKIKHKRYIVEEVIQQHPRLNELNPSSINSLRVITININNDPKIMAVILRIGVGEVVDNFSEGGLAAPVDIEKGIVYKEAITKTSKLNYKQHPVTKTHILGFQIPFWKEVKDCVLSASQKIPEVKTVGWDIAISKSGPEIIEGNDNWNKNVYQLSHKLGKKKELESILKENKVK